MNNPVTLEQLLAEVGITAAELRYFQNHFAAQLRALTTRETDGTLRFSREAILLLRSLSAMRAQGATPAQIKGWFGLT